MIQKWIKKASDKLGKYKYAALVVLLGTGILLFPKTAEKTADTQLPAAPVSAQEEKESLQTELKAMLGEMQGVGKADVLLSLESGAASTFWQDTQSQNQTQTVFTQSGSEKAPTLAKQDYPKYRGAVIVCEGAENAKVQLCVKEAVSSLTGLGSDKITVIKMKMQ